MTRITIDLTDSEVWHGQHGRLLDTVLTKVKAALPPVLIEPKAGGTCHHPNKDTPIRLIAYVDDIRVVIASRSKPDDPGYVVSRCEFDAYWEVLS